MHSAPVPVVSNQLKDADDECPVCLEPLSFSFRLPGEKPHIVPECGHALHEACFSAVYGPPPGADRSIPRKSNLGVCGVCRRPMKIGDGDGGKSNKLAALTGMGDSKSPSLYPGRDTPTARRGIPETHDPNADDPIEPTSRPNPNHPDTASPYIVAPSIQVRPEFSTISRTTDPTQPLTCIIVIELPGKRSSDAVPGSVLLDDYSAHNGRHNGSSYMPPNTLIHNEEDSPFNAITEDLRNRIIDWKGHPLSDLGPLQMYDLLSVRRDSAIREFYVYLFKEAIICVVEEKKRGLGRLLSNTSLDSSSVPSGTPSKGVLRLKGRIYVRHIKNVTASSAAGEMSLTIDMEDELASFILIFRDRSSLEAWKNNIQALVSMFQGSNHHRGALRDSDRPLDVEEFGGSQKAMRMLSGGSTQTTVSTVDSLLNGSSSRSTMSSSTSHASSMQMNSNPSRQMHQKLSTLGEDDETSVYDSPPSLVTPHTSSGPSNSLPPIPHPPTDLILVISVPPPNAQPSTAQLKIRVIKNTLDFIVGSLQPKDRLSVVAFEVGISGRVRKTPYLMVGRLQSKQRLTKFIDEIGARMEDSKDEFLVRGSKEEKTDVVTAVNHGLDVVLQRKSKNPVSGMILVSDASDSTRRAQMDLVLARAEAANVPIHSFGYGRSHDPASLWLMSNHTSGTYTFVKDWYDLQDCIAGCVGGMMSIGLLNMKLHMRIVDSQRFRIRKVSGGPTSILASNGQNVDVDVGELRANGRPLDATQEFVRGLGLEELSIEDPPDLTYGELARMIDEVPVVEVDGSFFDPAATKQITRLAHPVLLTITLLPLSQSAPKPPSTLSDPVIVRRRMELLASDMITRALVLVSRRNFQQAQKIMGETKRILHTVLTTVSKAVNPPPTGMVRNRREIQTLGAVRAMQGMLQDLQILSEALEENVEMFAHDQRNFGAQQAMILRDQKSWSGRSATERLFWTTDNSIELVSRSADWVPRDH
ncbi:Rho guanine nucleotide exchange factor scd1 [Leucoagaricus sp. SymC.cos]|nr:Rho guanine nucleotide exchange factor scd1 [Leucoagaricus sp. SymC.cos]